MPIYEYACKECNHTLDALQKMTDAPLLDCPECGEPALRRLISAPRFRLKGAGWYETDFKKDKQRNLLSTDSDAPAKDKADGKGAEKGADKGTDKGETRTDAPAKAKTEPAAASEKKPAPAAQKSSKADSA